MSAGLLDVNVLIALAWPSHVDHARAHAWFGHHASNGWATCPLTQLGFVRVSSNPAIIPEAVTPQDALRALARMVAHEHHVFWPDQLALADEHVPLALVMGHRQLTDAYLLGLAISKQGKLITFDETLEHLLSPQDPRQEAIELIGAGDKA